MTDAQAEAERVTACKSSPISKFQHVQQIMSLIAVDLEKQNPSLEVGI